VRFFVRWGGWKGKEDGYKADEEEAIIVSEFIAT
jgi:hypothetical protein